MPIRFDVNEVTVRACISAGAKPNLCLAICRSASERARARSASNHSDIKSTPADRSTNRARWTRTHAREKPRFTERHLRSDPRIGTQRASRSFCFQSRLKVPAYGAAAGKTECVREKEDRRIVGINLSRERFISRGRECVNVNVVTFKNTHLFFHFVCARLDRTARG